MVDFISEWTVTAGDLSITLPLVNGGTYNFTVNYGDGSGDKTVTTYNDADASHAYGSADTYTVTISGTIERWRFNNGGSKDKIVEISQWGDLSFGATDYQFYGCSNLTVTATDAPDLSNTISLNRCFYNCTSLTSLDLSSWDVSNVTNLYGCFWLCGLLTSIGDVSGWDTSNVTDLHNCFAGCSVLAPLAINSWDTSNVTDLGSCFNSCFALTSLDVSGWDTSKVTDLYFSFRKCNSLTSLDLSSWDVSIVEDLGYCFHECTLLTSIGDVSSWVTSSLTNLGNCFGLCSSLTGLEIHDWDVSSITAASSFLSGANNALTSSEYNQILMNWSEQALNNDVSIHFGDAQYDLGKPEDARTVLTDTYNWTVADGGDTGIPFCWNFTAKYKNSNKLFKASGLGSFPKKLWVPGNVDKSTGKMIDDGKMINPDDYKVE